MSEIDTQNTQNIDLSDGAQQAPREEYPGDCGTLPLELRQTLVRIQKAGIFSRETDKELWDQTVYRLPLIRKHLANQLLELVVNEELGLAALRVPEGLGQIEGTFPSLLSTDTHTLSSTLLLAHMRLLLHQANQKDRRAEISRVEIEDLLQPFLGGNKNPFETGNRKKINGYIRYMVDKKLLAEIARDLWEIKPIDALILTSTEANQLLEDCRKLQERERQAMENQGEQIADATVPPEGGAPEPAEDSAPEPAEDSTPEGEEKPDPQEDEESVRPPFYF